MTDLATKLRNGTQQSHSNAEHTSFMKTFLKGEVTKEAFCQLLSNLYFIYSQLESELECHKNDALISPLYFPELNRKANLEEDLDFYFGSNWSQEISPSPAAQNYITRLREISASEPVLLISHAYTRYMGDLSGGQGLKRIAQSVFNLAEHQGIRFYEFDQISDVNAFKVQYREALDGLAVDESQTERIVAEANNAFALNIAMLRDIDNHLSTVRA